MDKSFNAYIEHLSQVAEAMRRRAAILIEDSRLLVQMVERHRRLARETDSAVTIGLKVTPTQAAMRLFEENPDKDFTASDIKYHLETLRDRGELKSEALNLMFSSNDICRRLEKQTYLKRGGSGKNITFRKISKP